MTVHNPVPCSSACIVSIIRYTMHWKAYKWLCTRVSTYVDLEMCLLVETLVAFRNSTLITLPGFLSDLYLLFLSLISIQERKRGY
jgi:hypothetical protein